MQLGLYISVHIHQSYWFLFLKPNQVNHSFKLKLSLCHVIAVALKKKSLIIYINMYTVYIIGCLRTRHKRHNNLKLQCKKERCPNTNAQQVTLLIASLQGDVGLPGEPGDPGLKGEKVSVPLFASVFEWTKFFSKREWMCCFDFERDVCFIRSRLLLVGWSGTSRLIWPWRPLGNPWRKWWKGPKGGEGLHWTAGKECCSE